MDGRVLVTGCAGFIGSAVARQLLRAGTTVTGVDNLNDAYDPILKRWRLDELEQEPDFTFHNVDICDQKSLSEVFDRAHRSVPAGPTTDHAFQAVFHLAARAGVRASVSQPRAFYRDNVDGTLSLLESCRQAGVGKFVLASTSSLYGASLELPWSETADTNCPLSPYAASKKAAEALCHAYHHLHEIDTIVLRYFTAYGPAGRPDMSVFRFVRNIAEGRPITIYGDGHQRRDFTYVDDIARGTVAAAGLTGYEVVNLGSDRPVELREIVTRISQCVGRDPVIQYETTHSADVPATWADIGKAGRLLAWSPQVDVDEGIQRSVDWYREHRSWASAVDP